MKYSLINLFPNDRGQEKIGGGYYTHQLLAFLVSYYKHELIPNSLITPDTIILVPMFYLDSVPGLRKIRKQYPKNIIITGGQNAYNFPAVLIWSDIAVIGEGFEFFKCKDLEEAKSLPCVTYPGKKELIIPSDYIDWSIVPVCQTKKGIYMYWKGVGCRNKCGFCFTSWTKNRQENDPFRVKKVADIIKTKKGHLGLISNEYDEDFEVMVKDMMLKQYLKTPMKKGNPKLIRLGVEFPLEETRKKLGKPFTNDEFYQVLDKAFDEEKELNLFFIPGLSPLNDIRDLLAGYHRMGTKPHIFIKLTNLVYSQYTPAHKKVKEMRADYMASPQWAKYLKVYLDDHGGWRFSVLSCAYPQKSIYETALWHITSEEDYQLAVKIHKANTPEESVFMLKDSGLLDNDYAPLIKFWYQKNKTLEQAYAESNKNAEGYINKYLKK